MCIYMHGMSNECVCNCAGRNEIGSTCVRLNCAVNMLVCHALCPMYVCVWFCGFARCLCMVLWFRRSNASFFLVWIAAFVQIFCLWWFVAFP